MDEERHYYEMWLWEMYLLEKSLEGVEITEGTIEIEIELDQTQTKEENNENI
jgi:hypothetical protein